MSGFTCYSDQLQAILCKIVVDPKTHAKWLNTLSYLENCGARKIAAAEHPTFVKEEMLKHAAEEFRHAHHLKRQIEKISSPLENYSLQMLLGGMPSLHYLKALDLKASRYLSFVFGIAKPDLKKVAYLLVTYAIELRAEELYPIYDAALRRQGSKVVVKSILLEEKGHLQEMRREIEQLKINQDCVAMICRFESELCAKWLASLQLDLIASQDGY